MTKQIFNPQQWISGFDLANMTPAEFLALIDVLVDDTIDEMSVPYYQKRLDAIEQLAKLGQQKSGVVADCNPEDEYMGDWKKTSEKYKEVFELIIRVRELEDLLMPEQIDNWSRVQQRIVTKKLIAKFYVFTQEPIE